MILYKVKYRGRRKRKRIITVVLLVLILALAGLATFFYLTDGKNLFMPSPEEAPEAQQPAEQPIEQQPDTTNQQQTTEPQGNTDLMSEQDKLSSAKALYISETALNQIDNYIAFAKANQINAFIIDVKNEKGQVTYKSSLSSVSEAKSQKPASFDAKVIVAKLKENGITPIARLVCFKDDTAPRNLPDASVTVRENVLWLDYNNQRWLNPYSSAAWNYLADIANEASQAGFEEIMLDFMQFPEMGKLNLIDFGSQIKAKQQILLDFAVHIKEQTDKSGVKLSITVPADVALDVGNANAWGQGFHIADLPADTMAPQLYSQKLLSMMNSGTLTLDGVTNQSSSEQIVAAAASVIAKKLSVSQVLRPWIQASVQAEADNQIKGLGEVSVTGLNIYDPAETLTK